MSGTGVRALAVWGCFMIALGCSSCSEQELPTEPGSGAGARGMGRLPKWGNLPEIAGSSTTTTFTAGWDTWWENISGRGTGLCTSADTVWAKYNSCNLLALQRYKHPTKTPNGSYVARTYLAIDFDTSAIPDNAIIIGFPVLRFLVKDNSSDTTSTDPPQLSCGTSPAPDGPSVDATGVYFGQVDTLGAGGSFVDSVVTDVCAACSTCAPVYEDKENTQELDYSSPPYATIGTQLKTTFVSKTKVSRYGIDLENPVSTQVRTWFFTSADSVGYEPELDVEWSRYDFYGATLGDSAWAGFDSLLIPDLNSCESFECFAESLYIYLVWQNASGDTLKKLSPPVRLDQTSWFGTSEFEAGDFTVKVTYNPDLDVDTHACPEDDEVDATLNSDGTLCVGDSLFGGIGSNVKIELRASHSDPDSALVRVITLQWGQPGTYIDAEGNTVDAAPDGTHDSIVTLADTTFLGVSGCHFPIRLPTKIIEWVSTDIAGVDSIRVVNEDDLAAVSAELGHSVVWGFDSDTRNYHVNVNMYGGSALYIDASDIAMMVVDLDDGCIGSSKMTMGGLSSGETQKQKILEWFGIAPTGEMVVGGPAGELIPGYEVVDWEQNRRAIADPRGWRTEP